LNLFCEKFNAVSTQLFSVSKPRLVAAYSKRVPVAVAQPVAIKTPAGLKISVEAVAVKLFLNRLTSICVLVRSVPA
jgi:hypothetical protein